MMDPHCGAAARYVTRLPILGVTTTFVSDSAAALDTVREAYGAWARLDAHASVVSPSDAIVRINVRDHPHTPEPTPAFDYRVPEPTRLVVEWNGGSGEANTRRLESIAYVTSDLVSRKAAFIEGVLEPLTLFLLGALGREPLHAAAVARGPAAIVLAGPSGAGKSTLAYAAWRHGFSFLADDPVYVQVAPALRIWGRSARVRLTGEVRAHFAELRETPLTRLPGGKTKMVIELRERVRHYADHVGICLLQRARGVRPTLERIPPDRAVDELSTDLEPGFDLFADTIRERLARLAERGAWTLQLSREAADALPLLDQIAAELADGL